jgi:hypothetical protein
VRDLLCVTDDARLLLCEIAAHLVGRAAAQDDGYVFGSRLIQHRAETFADRQDADEHRDDAGDANQRNHRRCEPRRQVLQVHRRDRRDLRE